MKYIVKDPLKENGVTVAGSDKILINSTQEYSFNTDPNPTSDVVKIVRWEIYENSDSNSNSASIEIAEYDDSKVVINAVGQPGQEASIRAIYTKNGENKEYTTPYFNIELVDYLKGDVNRDGKINADDVARLIDLYKTSTYTSLDVAVGDMDGNGKLNADDAAKIVDLYKNS